MCASVCDGAGLAAVGSVIQPLKALAESRRDRCGADG